MAIPHQALTMNFNNPLKAGNTWRINFSRVQWLKEKGPEKVGMDSYRKNRYAHARPLGISLFRRQASGNLAG